MTANHSDSHQHLLGMDPKVGAIYISTMHACVMSSLVPIETFFKKKTFKNNVPNPCHKGTLTSSMVDESSKPWLVKTWLKVVHPVALFGWAQASIVKKLVQSSNKSQCVFAPAPLNISYNCLAWAHGFWDLVFSHSFLRGVCIWNGTPWAEL